MNASSRKVLQKVLSGFIITEPNRKRSGVKGRRRCPRMKRVLGWSGFLFMWHDATNQKKEREKEKESIRKAPTTIYQNIKN